MHKTATSILDNMGYLLGMTVSIFLLLQFALIQRLHQGSGSIVFMVLQPADFPLLAENGY